MRNMNCINSQDDIRFLFEAIKQIAPQSILDVGMFFKRLGYISRQALGLEIASDCILDGIDCMPELDVPVYHTIYNHIISLEEYLAHTASLEYQPFSKRTYDLVAVMQPNDIIPPQSLPSMWRWISSNSRYAVTNYFDGVYDSIPNIARHKEFQSNGQPYSLIIFR